MNLSRPLRLAALAAALAGAPLAGARATAPHPANEILAPTSVAALSSPAGDLIAEEGRGGNSVGVG